MLKIAIPERRLAEPAVTPVKDHRATLARRLEVLAGCELQQGHYDAAECLAWQAARLRANAR